MWTPPSEGARPALPRSDYVAARRGAESTRMLTTRGATARSCDGDQLIEWTAFITALLRREAV